MYEPPTLDTEKLTKKIAGNEVKVWIDCLFLFVLVMVIQTV